MPKQSQDDRAAQGADERRARRRGERRRQLRGRLLAGGLVLLAAGGAAAFVATRGGNGGGGDAGTTGSATPSSPLRWVVGDGPPETVRQENAHPGNAAWRLPPKRRSGTLSAYLSSQDAMPGDAERLYIRAPGSKTARVRIFRIGWYGGRGGREVATSAPVRVPKQPSCSNNLKTGLSECKWKQSLVFRLPRGLVSGVYVARIDSDRGLSREALMVVGGSAAAPLLVQIPTTTYEAYNGFGGHSVYPGGTPIQATGAAQGVEVSYDRPYDSPTGASEFFDRDVAMVGFIERHGYPAIYTTPTTVDRRPSVLSGRRMIVDSGHSEYWSDRMVRAFRRARDRGTNIAFFSSDTAAWRIEFAPATRRSSSPRAPDHRFTAYKEHASADPLHRAVTFPDKGASLTGTAYTDCIAPRIRGTATPTYHYYDWKPNPRAAPAWLFRGTGLTARTRVRGILGYELDHVTPASPPGIKVVGGGTLPCMDRTAPPRGDTTLYRAKSGAWVFSTGTLGWMFGLTPTPGASPDAPKRPNPGLVRMTQNIFSFMLAKR